VFYIWSMELIEARNKFIQAWGTLGQSWGINKTMAQIHALLLISHEPLSTEEVMQELNISRGNANMNIRALIDWGLVFKEFKPGERKEYFTSEKEMWEVTRQVIAERRKRELEPVLKVLNQVKEVGEDTPEAKEFKTITTEISKFADQADQLLNKMARMDRHWFFGPLMRLFK